jgi:outer membrane lipoprotein SlyB
MKKLILTLSVTAALLFTGCASSMSPTVANGDMMEVSTAKVLSVKNIKMKGENATMIEGAGTVIGGLAGSLFGQGTGKTIAVVGGAGLGNMASGLFTDVDGYLITFNDSTGKKRSFEKPQSRGEVKKGDVIELHFNGAGKLVDITVVDKEDANQFASEAVQNTATMNAKHDAQQEKLNDQNMKRAQKKGSR